MKLPLKINRPTDHNPPLTPIRISDDTGKVICTLPHDERMLAERIVLEFNKPFCRQDWLETRNTGLEEYNAKAS